MTETENRALYIAEQCRRAGITLAGAAGILGNIEAESGFSPINLQDSYERPIGMNDQQYTEAVDNGSYAMKFTSDAAGYGLCQWTAWDRKAGMLKFHKERDVSIGDFRTQVDWMLEEIKDYAAEWNTVTSSNDPYECGSVVCKRYEIPADTEAAANHRGGLAQKWYKWLKFMMEAGEESSLPESGVKIDDEGIPVPQTWPPRVTDRNCTGWPEVKLLQLLLNMQGYNLLTDGIWTESLEKAVRIFQGAHGLGVDGEVGPKSWVALGLDKALFEK